MKKHLVVVVVSLAAAVAASGCGLTGTEPTEPPAQSGHVTINGHSENTQSVECIQTDWNLTIEARAGDGGARAFLELGGEKPIVRTLNIENIRGVSAVAGSGIGNAEATADGDVYTITGSAIGSDRAAPGQRQTMPFEFKAPC